MQLDDLAIGEIKDVTNYIIEHLIKQHGLAVGRLTEAQLADVLKQAIACGDFERYVEPSGGQQVVYIPFRRQQELLNHISRLQETLNSIKKTLEDAPEW